MCPLQSIPVTYTRDRSAYVVDLLLAPVESTAFGRQGPEVQILSPRPFNQTLTFVANLKSANVGQKCRSKFTAAPSSPGNVLAVQPIPYCRDRRTL